MTMTFRWYGDSDPVTPEHIRQIPGVTGVVSAIYDIPVGEPWPLSRIQALKKRINDAGLAFSVVESVPVHEDIKLGLPSRDRYIDAYIATLRNLTAAGISCVCYNFMPVFDWTRTDLSFRLPDGSHALIYREADLRAMDPAKGDLSLPGWDESYTKEELRSLLSAYSHVSEEDLWENLRYFLSRVIPVAEEVHVKMAIHPDDPPWSIFGLPRIITNQANLERFLALYDSPYNGLTFCTGSLGASADNDLIGMIRRFSERIHFAHIRNIRRTGERDFEEAAHPTECGSLDIYGIVKALCDTGFDGFVRPDHGRMIFGETGRPGYGLFDRALGAAYLHGLFESVKKGGTSK